MSFINLFFTKDMAVVIQAKRFFVLLVLSAALGACSSISDKSEFINQNVVNKNRVLVDEEKDSASEVVAKDRVVKGKAVKDKKAKGKKNKKKVAKEKKNAAKQEPVVSIPAPAKQGYDAALLAVDKKDWPGAIAQLQKLAKRYSKLPGARVALGWVYWQSGDQAAAAHEFRVSIDSNKLTRADAYNYLAIIQREQGKFSDAESLYKEAIDRWPNDAVLFENLGILYELYLGRFKDALLAYKQAQIIKGDTDKKLKGWIKVLERKVS